jgi:hypothetical protein
MSNIPDPTLLALHNLRIAGELSIERLSTLPGVRREHLYRLEADGLIVCKRQGTAWAVTDAGRDLVNQLVEQELVLTKARSVVEGAYERFRALNNPFLEICASWQLRDGVNNRNDHSDHRYDQRVLNRLVRIHSQVKPICKCLESCLHRFNGYEHRFASAVAQLNAGRLEWLTNPSIDSYHTVWFELHEDLLVTLGKRRSEEYL